MIYQHLEISRVLSKLCNQDITFYRENGKGKLSGKFCEISISLENCHETNECIEALISTIQISYPELIL